MRFFRRRRRYEVKMTVKDEQRERRYVSFLACLNFKAFGNVLAANSCRIKMTDDGNAVVKKLFVLFRIVSVCERIGRKQVKAV